jgi:hypothetical protein
LNESITRAEISTKLSGIIFRKALLDNDFPGVYSRVLEKIETIPEEQFDTFQMLEILGEVGG